MAYYAANDYCKSLDERAHLAEIRNPEIQEFIEGLMKNVSPKYWWLGGVLKVNQIHIERYLK